ncbi:MAG TPA: hypothetical protein VFF25_02550 [Clostridia bacterium]|nr:hypothetical protein [Clostridia bacterium]
MKINRNLCNKKHPDTILDSGRSLLHYINYCRKSYDIAVYGSEIYGIILDNGLRQPGQYMGARSDTGIQGGEGIN